METVHEDFYRNDLHCRIYQPADPVNLNKGTALKVLIGLGGSISQDLTSNNLWLNNNTDALARALAEHGFFTFIFSPPGHGRSQGPFSIDAYTQASNDVEKYIKDASRFEEVGGLGHSLGAYIALRDNCPKVSVLGLPIYPKEILDRFKLTPIYSLVEGRKFEEQVCKLFLAVIDNILIYPRGPRFKLNTLEHLKVDSASELAREFMYAEDLGSKHVELPKKEAILALLSENDGILYSRLTDEKKEDYKKRLSHCVENPENLELMVLEGADHNLTSKDKPGMLMVHPQFEHAIEKTAEFFSS